MIVLHGKTLERAEIASLPDLSMHLSDKRLITQNEFATVGHQVGQAISENHRGVSNRKNTSRRSHSPEAILCQRHAR
jgi:hypothetical protein